MRSRVVVTLKTGILDPQGKAIEGALKSLGIDGVASVRQGKLFDIELAGVAPDGAEPLLRVACEKLLANTVVENFRIEVARADSTELADGPEDGEDEFAPDEPVDAAPSA